MLSSGGTDGSPRRKWQSPMCPMPWMLLRTCSMPPSSVCCVVNCGSTASRTRCAPVMLTGQSLTGTGLLQSLLVLRASEAVLSAPSERHGRPDLEQLSVRAQALQAVQAQSRSHCGAVTPAQAASISLLTWHAPVCRAWCGHHSAICRLSCGGGS